MFSDPAHTHIFLDPTYLITPLEINPILYAWLTTEGLTRVRSDRGGGYSPKNSRNGSTNRTTNIAANPTT
jgi:hypothetical protein